MKKHDQWRKDYEAAYFRTHGRRCTLTMSYDSKGKFWGRWYIVEEGKDPELARMYNHRYRYAEIVSMTKVLQARPEHQS